MAGKDAGRTHWTYRLIAAAAAGIVWGLVSVPQVLDLAATAEAQSSRGPASRGPAARTASAKPTSTAEQPPQIMAVVNRQTITRDELARECIRRFGKEVLESEVNKHLILQACHERNVKITAGEVDAEIARMAGKFGLSVDRWLEMLQAERNLTADQYRRDIVWPTLALRRLAAGQTEVTPLELEQAFESEYGPAVQVRLMVSRSRQRAEKLLAEAQARPDEFDRLAKDNSEDDNSAATRGLIPPIRRHVGDATVERAAFALRPGEISPIIESANQFLILKCERHLPARKLTAQQKQQVLEQLKESVADRKLRATASKMFQQLQRHAEIVNVHNDPELSKKMPGIAATINGRQITMRQLGEQCIVRHGELVLEGEIHRALLNQALKRRSQQVSQADLQAEIRRAAQSYGFVKADGQPDVDRWLQKVTAEGDVTVDTYVRDAVWPTVALKKLVSADVQVSDEDLQKGFHANYGERVEILAIVVSSQRTAHEVFDLARKNPSEKFFGELAHQYSVEPVSRANFGQVPPIRQYGGQPLIEQEAFKLKPGEISGVLAMGDKFIILRCLGRTQPVVDDLAVVREELEQDIREKKIRVAMSREFDRLKERSQVDNFLAGTSQSGTEKQAQPASFQHPAPAPTAPRRSSATPAPGPRRATRTSR